MTVGEFEEYEKKKDDRTDGVPVLGAYIKAFVSDNP